MWPGGLLVLKGESKYGTSDNANTGALVPVNTLSLYPAPQDDITALTDLYALQFLADWVGILAGKMTFRIGFAGGEHFKAGAGRRASRTRGSGADHPW